MGNIAIHWFRQDLRLSDNPALTAASLHEGVLPIYILDEGGAGEHSMGAASKWWLNSSLESLNASLGGALSLYSGNPIDILMGIIKRHNVNAVYWNRCYEPWRIQRDTLIKKDLNTQGVKSESYNGSLLWEPWEIKKNNGECYSVFTPFYRKGCLQGKAPRQPLPALSNIKYYCDTKKTLSINQLQLLPYIPWNGKLDSHWVIGEEGARVRFQKFMDEDLSQYKNGRNLPSKSHVSKLSPYLHFGEISPNQLWHKVHNTSNDAHNDHFCSELGWREFSYNQLYYYPDLPNKNLQPKFNHFPWRTDETALQAWKKGQTGIPMVDAGMRELWETGYMHNRARMIVGSFLVKNLRIHWRHGERWFWDTLVDADLANNSASWQWVSGCGRDAAPYFRIFNPVTQGQKFDPKGDYVRRFIPEISSLPNQYLFNPWDAPDSILKEANIKLGNTYPKPIVDLKVSRDNTLKAFAQLSSLSE
jgi:deoxyribodipyrimidine photo-lyase|tara:strand:- start:24709 stop:26130 length:1422 start_codon:yes stop_codon:yes gene_type:complete